MFNLVVVQDEDECEDEDYEDEEDADDEVIEEGCYHMMPRKQNCRHLNDTQVSVASSLRVVVGCGGCGGCGGGEGGGEVVVLFFVFVIEDIEEGGIEQLSEN